MKKKILTVFIGGTICTTIENGVMNTSSAASSALIEYYKNGNSPFREQVEIEEGENFGILSENMTVDIWNRMIKYFLDNLSEMSRYDGIVVAHGTDTLAYTTSLFSLLLRGFGVPVIFVSSNYSIIQENKMPNLKANGVDNYRAAIECICQGISPGVYATYKNPEDGRMYLHSGAHLRQCEIYDENFYSRDAVDITDFNGVNLTSLWKESENTFDDMPIKSLKEKKLENKILKINPYVGLNYDMFNLADVKAVLHGTYHSGTACVVKTEKEPNYSHSNSSILRFFDKCATADRPIPFYFSPSKVGEEVNVYASVPFIEHHITNNQKPVILYGQTDELIYVKLLFACSVDLEKEQIDLLLSEE